MVPRKFRRRSVWMNFSRPRLCILVTEAVIALMKNAVPTNPKRAEQIAEKRSRVVPGKTSIVPTKDESAQ